MTHFYLNINPHDLDLRAFDLETGALYCTLPRPAHGFITYYAPALLCLRQGGLQSGPRCLSVRPSVCPVPRHNSRTERPRKPTFSRMEANTRLFREPI